MNFIRSCIRSSFTALPIHNFIPRPFLFTGSTFLNALGIRPINTLERLHRRGRRVKIRKDKSPLGPGVPNLKGIVLKTLIKKPKKPNSGNRKCVLVRLSNGREVTVYVPGVGHNLQEHNVVMVRNGRTKDVPGLKLKCVRGKYDLPHVLKEKPV